jgi:hypothetical protein
MPEMKQSHLVHYELLVCVQERYLCGARFSEPRTGVTGAMHACRQSALTAVSRYGHDVLPKMQRNNNHVLWHRREIRNPSPRVTDAPSFSRDTGAIVTMTAKILLSPHAQELCS